jgi:hypothetical protein
MPDTSNTPMNDEVRLGLQFVQCRTTSFAVSEPATIQQGEQRIDYEINNTIQVNPNEELVNILFTVSGKVADGTTGNGPVPTMQISTVSTFRVSGLGFLPVTTDGEVQIPGPLIVTIVALAFSTTRGMLSTRAAGTAWQDFILPITDARTVLPQIVNDDTPMTAM